MKEDLQKLYLQIKKDFGNLVSKAAKEKKSARLSNRGCFFDKNKIWETRRDREIR